MSKITRTEKSYTYKVNGVELNGTEMKLSSKVVYLPNRFPENKGETVKAYEKALQKLKTPTFTPVNVEYVSYIEELRVTDSEYFRLISWGKDDTPMTAVDISNAFLNYLYPADFVDEINHIIKKYHSEETSEVSSEESSDETADETAEGA